MNVYKIFYGGEWQTCVDASTPSEAIMKWSKLVGADPDKATAEVLYESE